MKMRFMEFEAKPSAVTQSYQVRWCWPRRSRFGSEQYRWARALAGEIAVRREYRRRGAGLSRLAVAVGSQGPELAGRWQACGKTLVILANELVMKPALFDSLLVVRN